MIKQNPFSFYDFLGYLIPGAIICYLVLLLNQFEHINSLSDIIFIVTKSQEFQLDKILFFIIISYCLGHLISYLSSITIEKYSNWKYDYPSKYLLGFNSVQKYYSKKAPWKIKFFKILLAIILLPIVTFDLILGEYFNFKAFYTKKLDEFLVAVIKDKNIILLDKLYPTGYKGIKGHDFHRIISHYVYENSKNHQFKMTNYIALYGFLRAVAFISNAIFWIVLIITIKNAFTYFSTLQFLNFANLISSIDFTRIFTLFILGLVSYVYFMGFMKFYRRYSLEVYMLVAIDADLIAKDDDNLG